MVIMRKDQTQAEVPGEAPTADLATARAFELAELRLSPGYLLARLGAESRSLWGRMLSEHGLTPHHFGVLMALAQSGGEAPQQRLVATIGVDSRNAVAILDGLSERALLTRSVDPQDRRRHLIEITPQGAAVVTDLRHAGVALEDEMFLGLDGAERDVLHTLLLKLFDARTRPSRHSPSTPS